MTEAIRLGPVRVHAISVSVKRDPNSIMGVDEMMLQVGENGGVQVDLFGRDIQGNELHESRELQEEEYEAMRANLLHAERASMPSFSSFRSGNTIGRVVGETMSTQVPASQANPQIEAETEEESVTGEHVLDGIQLGLDVVGLIPVFGEVADIANAGVSAARGDYVGAGLSLASAIPFVGWLGAAAKVTKRASATSESLNKTGVAREITDGAGAQITKQEGRRSQDGARVLGNAKAAKRAQLKRNQRDGKDREKQVEADLEREGHEVLGTQVSAKTQLSRRVIDILIKDNKTGQVRAVEVKAGGAKRSTAQVAKDNAMASDGAKLVGKNAPVESAYQGTMKINTEVIH